MNKEIKITPIEQSNISNIDFDNLPFGRVFADHMFSADYRDGSWGNYEIKPLERLSLHPSFLALHYGQSIFEGMKATKHKDGRPLFFRPELHAKRINKSAARMCMPDFPEDMFMEAIHKLVDIDSDWIPKENGSALYIRPVMFATDEYIGVTESNTYKLLIFCLPVGPYYNKPVRLKVEREFVRAAMGGVGEAKTAGNYAASLLPARYAKNEGFDQVIWMDAKEFKYVQEVGTMNLFFVFKDKIVTPATEGTILKGITRDSIIHILRNEGHTVEERRLSIDEVKESVENGSFVEAFGAGTAAVVANVAHIADNDFKIDIPEENWIISRSLKKYINDLRVGDVEDEFGWIVPVKG